MKQSTKATLRDCCQRTATILDAWAKDRFARGAWKRAFQQQAAWIRKQAKL